MTTYLTITNCEAAGIASFRQYWDKPCRPGRSSSVESLLRGCTRLTRVNASSNRLDGSRRVPLPGPFGPATSEASAVFWAATRPVGQLHRATQRKKPGLLAT
jgi:hypothetical protein